MFRNIWMNWNSFSLILNRNLIGVVIWMKFKAIETSIQLDNTNRTIFFFLNFGSFHMQTHISINKIDFIQRKTNWEMVKRKEKQNEIIDPNKYVLVMTNEHINYDSNRQRAKAKQTLTLIDFFIIIYFCIQRILSFSLIWFCHILQIQSSIE